MINEVNENINAATVDATMPAETQYVDEFGNPIDPSLIDENGNYIGEQVTQYVDEFGNPIDPSLIDENGNYIGNQPTQYIDEAGNPISENVQTSTIDHNELASQLSAASEIETVQAPEQQNQEQTISSAGAHQMDDKELITGMVTFDYNNVPITDIVNSIILDSINKGASDIHFDPFDDGIKIRLRVDGQLNDYSIVPLYVKKNMITRIKIISGMNITESRVPQDGAIRTELQNKTIDLRVSCLPTNMGEKLVVRIMDYSMSAQGIDALDFSDENLTKIKRMLELPNGIILVTGATGSGKSTTVYSMLQKLNVEDTNLITVEDPIEMNIGGINQVQAVSEIGLTFATVLRSILRQDPDVIMIGEIRDDETARIAVRASITGHLVLSTIHTNNSLSTIERLTDMSVERYLLGSSLSGIVSQKLSRRLCEKCKKLRPTTDYEKDIFKQALHADVEEIYEAVGCPECSRGYRGRIAIHEVLLLNQMIKDAITRGAEKAELRGLVYSNSGTDTMLQDGLRKAMEGKTSFEEVLKLVDLEDDLGTGTQLGLEAQIEASNMNMISEKNGDQAININISPDVLQSALSNANIAPQQPMYIPYPMNMNMENFDPENMPDPKDMPQMQYPQGMAQPMYIPYPVSMESDTEEEQEIILKPKKKAKKTTIVEIDPEALFEDEIVTKIKKVKKRKVEVEEIEDDDDEPIIIKKQKKKPKVEIIEEEIPSTVEIIENDTKENIEESIEEITPVIEEIKTPDSEPTPIIEEFEDFIEENTEEIEELIDEDNLIDNVTLEDSTPTLEDLKFNLEKQLKQLHQTKNTINKKKFNIKANIILDEIETLYNDIKTQELDYELNKNNIKELLNAIEQYLVNNNKKDKKAYENTKNRITNIFGVVADEISKDKIVDDTIKMVDIEFPVNENIDLSILDEPIEEQPKKIEPKKSTKKKKIQQEGIAVTIQDEILPFTIMEDTPEEIEEEEIGINIENINDKPLFEIAEDVEEIEYLEDDELEGISIDINEDNPINIVSTDDITFKDTPLNANTISDVDINNLIDQLDNIDNE